jgi:signal transduction histidine kinase
LPVQLRGLNPGLHEIHQLQELDGTWHIVVADIARGRLYVLYDATEHEARVDEFGVLVLGMGLLCIAAAYVLARRLARIAVAPLLDLTQRLADWAPGAPDIAITRDDEAGRLFEAFNRMQNQVDRSIAREREFAANLSHEARTPLAAIRTDAELMLLDDDWPVDARQRLTRIVANVDNIAVALESARSVARDQPRPAERVDLAACVDEAWRDLEPLARAAGLSLRNEVPASQARTLDKYALLTVLRNLVRNAIEHAAPAGLTVTLTAAGALELRDTGKGIAEEELPFVFTRYYAGRLRDAPAAPGANATAARRGLGLAIAKQVCDMQGWRLEVSSRREPPAQGTCFTLHLP